MQETINSHVQTVCTQIMHVTYVRQSCMCNQSHVLHNDNTITI